MTLPSWFPKPFDPSPKPPPPGHKPPGYPGWTPKKRGSSGLGVAYVQNLLNARLPEKKPLWVDGIFGPRTEERVKHYQFQKFGGFFGSTFGKVVPGVVCQITITKLEAGPPPIRRRPQGAPKDKPEPYVPPVEGL